VYVNMCVCVFKKLKKIIIIIKKERKIYSKLMRGCDFLTGVPSLEASQVRQISLSFFFPE
jgi:hypothetical protein